MMGQATVYEVKLLHLVTTESIAVSNSSNSREYSSKCISNYKTLYLLSTEPIEVTTEPIEVTRNGMAYRA